MGLNTRAGNSPALLEAANGSTIDTCGERLRTLSINVRQFEWKYTIANVTQPLLGADFLSANALMVDIKGQRLVDAKTFMFLPLQVKNGSSQGILIVATGEFAASYSLEVH